MTALETRAYELYCDSPELHGNHSTAFYAPGNSGNVRVITRARVRILAARAGWTHVRSELGRKYDLDYCPEHAPDGVARAARQRDRRDALRGVS